MEPTRPAKFVLGGFATSSAPALPSSCAAATAAAAAVRGSEVDYRCAATIDKTHHLRLLSLYYSYTIGVLPISDSNTGRCQLSLCTAIPCIVDNETIIDSRLRRNFGLTSATCSASPSLSGTHCGREHLCSAEGNKRCAAVIDVCKPPPITLHGLYDSSMSAKPPSKSPQLLPQLDKRPERQWPLPLARQRPQIHIPEHVRSAGDVEIVHL